MSNSKSQQLVAVTEHQKEGIFSTQRNLGDWLRMVRGEVRYSLQGKSELVNGMAGSSKVTAEKGFVIFGF